MAAALPKLSLGSSSASSQSRPLPTLGFNWRFLRHSQEPILSARKQSTPRYPQPPSTNSTKRSSDQQHYQRSRYVKDSILSSSGAAASTQELQSQLARFLEDLDHRIQSHPVLASSPQPTNNAAQKPTTEEIEQLLTNAENDDPPTTSRVPGSPHVSQPPQQVAGVDDEEDDEDAFVAQSAPCIIWHSSNRVRLATNLPPELRGKAISQSATGPIPDLWDDNFLPVQKKSTRKLLNTPRLRAQKYGAWYLPVSQWRMPNVTGDRAVGSDQQNQADNELEQLVADMEAEIVKLYSAKMFRGYIKKNNHRMPHYLQRMDDNKEY